MDNGIWSWETLYHLSVLGWVLICSASELPEARSAVSPAACCLSWHLLWLANNKVCSCWKTWMSCLERWDVCFALKKIGSRTDLLSGLYSCNTLGASPRWLHFHLECHTEWTQIVSHANCRASSPEHLDICSGIWHWLSPAFVGSLSRYGELLEDVNLKENRLLSCSEKICTYKRQKIIVLEVHLLFVFKSDEVNMIRSEWVEMILTCEATAVPWTGWGTFSSTCIAEVCCVSMKTEGVLGSELSMRSTQPHSLHTYLSWNCSSLGGKGMEGTVCKFTSVTGLLFSCGCLAYNIGRCCTHLFHLIVFFLLAECLDLRITCLLWTLL